jgi:hypothetical protein
LKFEKNITFSGVKEQLSFGVDTFVCCFNILESKILRRSKQFFFWKNSRSKVDQLMLPIDGTGLSGFHWMSFSNHLLDLPRCMVNMFSSFSTLRCKSWLHDIYLRTYVWAQRKLNFFKWKTDWTNMDRIWVISLTQKFAVVYWLSNFLVNVNFVLDKVLFVLMKYFDGQNAWISSIVA